MSLNYPINMSDKFSTEPETDYKKIIEKITKEKEDRHKNLEDLMRRKRQLDKKKEMYLRSHQSTGIRQASSTERLVENQKIHQYLSPSRPKQMIPPKFKSNNRFDEEEFYKKIESEKAQRNKYELVDRRARYATLVKEIFLPTVSPQKKLEVEIRSQEKVYRNKGDSKGTSIERDQKTFLSSDRLMNSQSHPIIKKLDSDWNQNTISNKVT